ncbi:methyltransferase domain-containing protein [Solibacillus sp.]|uniref:SAM-dependent methyltransferase n=1 Tax=Solibacillus sp. TaxID=1909654 RepID=UPI00331635B4
MDHLIACMKIIGDDTIQRTQLKHRLTLVNAFGIQPGMRVLEIGCGQGDTTVALAEAVGDAGQVVAIDIATPDYGAPITLGEAAQTISQSPIGKRITFHFETDFLTFDTTEHFDVVVLSHCSWYFKNPEQLFAYFNKMKTMTTRVCFAEWDMDYRELSQRSHFCAVNLQALYSAYFGGDGNILNVFHQKQIKQMLMEAEFTITKELVVDATYLQDGAWEIAYAKELYPALQTTPQPIQTMATTYFHLMQADEQKSLNSFVIIANI